jgi:hypothetical protein
MEIINTEYHGWECLPQMKKLCDAVGMVAQYKYEINNCVRTSSVEEIVSAYRDMISEIQSILDDLDRNYTNVKFVTKKKAIQLNNTQMKMVGGCCICGDYYETAPFSIAKYEEWVDAEVRGIVILIQNQFPELSRGDREFLITGISPRGWVEMFGEL